MRRDTLEQSAQLQSAMAVLTFAISTEEMRQLNYEIDGNKRDLKEVVRTWLAQKGF